MDQRDNGGVFDHAEFAPLQVIDLEAQQFGEIEERYPPFRDCQSP